MPELTAEDVFRIHPKVRWAAFATRDGTVQFSKMRLGIKSLSPQTEDEGFMQLGPQMVLGIFERFSPYAGAVNTAYAEYEKYLMFITKTRGGFLAFTVDKNPESELPETIPKIIQSVRELG